MKNNETIPYSEYMKMQNDEKYPETGNYPAPETAVIPPPGDKIIAYMKSQFANQTTHFKVGIRSTNHELPVKNA